jgi:hypothetical protein
MARQQKQRNHGKGKTILRLPDLEQSRSAVLNSLAAASSQESYGHAIDEFTGWYCSEPRLAFNRTVVLRYRFFLEQKQFAPSTINVRLAAVRRLAYEAADAGLLSPELAAGIRRVKGAKRLGKRVGNWLPSIRLVHSYNAMERAICICAASGIGLSLPFCLGVVCVERNWSDCAWRMCNFRRTTGSSPILLERLSTFGPSPLQPGPRMPWTNGQLGQKSGTATCSGR